MSQYVVVENGEITERYDSIPKNWRNVSGFYLMTDQERAARGFLPVKQSDIIFDPVRHRLISNDVKLDKNGVPYVDRVVEEIMTGQEFENYRFQEALSILRNKRNSLLSASDWAMTIDLIAIKGEEWKNAWSEYRQNLRNITDFYKESQTIFNPNDIIFPESPKI